MASSLFIVLSYNLSPGPLVFVLVLDPEVLMYPFLAAQWVRLSAV